MSQVGLDQAGIGRHRLTSFEKVDTRAITSDVKVLLQHSAFLDPKLSEVVSSVITDEDHSSWFQHLAKDRYQVSTANKN